MADPRQKDDLLADIRARISKALEQLDEERQRLEAAIRALGEETGKSPGKRRAKGRKGARPNRKAATRGAAPRGQQAPRPRPKRSDKDR